MLYSIQEQEWIQNVWTAHIHDIRQTIMIEENQHFKVTWLSGPRFLVNLEYVLETGFLRENNISITIKAQSQDQLTSYNTCVSSWIRENSAKESLMQTHWIMSGATRSEKTSVTLKIKVKLGRMCHLAIDDRPSWAVTTLISIAFRLREKSEEMKRLSRFC